MEAALFLVGKKEAAANAAATEIIHAGISHALRDNPQKRNKCRYDTVHVVAYQPCYHEVAEQ